MKFFTLFLALILVFSFGSNLFAADEKKIEKKILVKTTEKKVRFGSRCFNYSKGRHRKS